MKVVINGREYDQMTPESAQLLHLMELKQQTKPYTDDGKGLGMYALQNAARMEAEDPELAFAVMLFLTRRAAGDKVTFEQAASIPFTAIQFVPEPGDVLPTTVDEDPTVPGGQETPEAPGDQAGDVTPDATTPSTT